MQAIATSPAWENFAQTFRHVATSLIQVNWNAIWLSVGLVLIVCMLQLCRRLPARAYSRWRLGLLLAATLTPFFLCFWTWAAGIFKAVYSHYQAPYLWQQVQSYITAFSPAPDGIPVPTTVERVVIWSYAAWLVVFPVYLLFKTAPLRRLLRKHSESDPFWIKTAEWPWQRTLWDELLDRFYISRPVRVIEIEESHPMTVGFFRPVIVLPDGITADSLGLNEPARLRAVMAHELAHVRYHSLWAVVHRLAMWLFPLPLLPVWAFNYAWKRFLRLQMDVDQARDILRKKAEAIMETSGGQSLVTRLLRWLERLVAPLPDPAALMDAEFELHADHAAVRKGDADPVVLKETLLKVMLYATQDEELARALRRIKTPADLDSVLEGIKRARGFFGARHPRLMDFPPDKGISLATKLWKAALGLFAACPLALLWIPAFVFLAKTGSELTSTSPKGFVRATATPSMVAAKSDPKPAPKVVVVPPPVPKRPPAPARPATPPPVTVATTRLAVNPPPVDSRPPSLRQPQPATQPSSLISGQEMSRQIATANDQQRRAQDRMFSEQRGNESIRIQQENAARTRSAMASETRAFNQIQGAERTRQSASAFANASQQNQRAVQMAQQSLDAGNRQSSMQRAIQGAERASQLAFQSTTRNQQTANQPRIPTPVQISPQPYNQPRAVTPTTVHTPPVRSFNHSPPPTFSQPRIYTPPPTPYIPPPPPRMR